MRTNNPVLSRPDAFTPAYDAGSAPYGYTQPGQQPQGYTQDQWQSSWQQSPQAPQAPTGRMTIDDVITKTAILLIGVFAFAGLAWILVPIQLVGPVAIVSSIVAFITVLIVSARRNVAPGAVLAYAAVEGILIGCFSKLFELLYPGIVIQAVAGTAVAAFVLLALYRNRGWRVRGRAAQVVTVGIISYAVIALGNLILALFGVHTGLFTIGGQAGMIAWLAAGLGIVLAAASLLMDFEAIETGVRIGAPAEESWRAALGLVVTMVWLYTLLLRVLSFFRD